AKTPADSPRFVDVVSVYVQRARTLKQPANAVPVVRAALERAQGVTPAAERPRNTLERMLAELLLETAQADQVVHRLLRLTSHDPFLEGQPQREILGRVLQERLRTAQAPEFGRLLLGKDRETVAERLLVADALLAR